MKKLKTLLILLSLFTLTFECAQAKTSAKCIKNYGNIKIYSKMDYIENESEFYGIQIAIINYEKGIKVLWQSGNGKLANPLLLDSSLEGNNLNIIVPESDENHGEWTLTFNEKSIKATGPRDLKFILKKSNNFCE